ncbi:MAG: DNA alkylation repair protein [Leptospirales bacterium]
MSVDQALKELRSCSEPDWIPVIRRFFRNPDDHVFWGVRKAGVKSVARNFVDLPFSGIGECLNSGIHEVRSMALWILRFRYESGTEPERETVFRFYLEQRQSVSEWDWVDESAPYLVGRHLFGRDLSILFELAASDRMWDRRIAIVSTWWFIRNGRMDTTLELAERLLEDTEDLMHKATGWMLREVGKRNLPSLTGFLDSWHARMPRTMLRYALERFSPEQRYRYLKGKGVSFSHHLEGVSRNPERHP